MNLILNGSFRFQNVAKLPITFMHIEGDRLCDKWRVSDFKDTLFSVAENGFNALTSGELEIYQTNVGELGGLYTFSLDVSNNLKDSVVVVSIRRFNNETEETLEEKIRVDGSKRKSCYFLFRDNGFSFDRYEVRIKFPVAKNATHKVSNILLNTGLNDLFYASMYEEEYIEICRYQQTLFLHQTGIKPRIDLIYPMLEGVTKSISFSDVNGIFLDKPIHIESIQYENNALLVSSNSYTIGNFKHFDGGFKIIVDGDL